MTNQFIAKLEKFFERPNQPNIDLTNHLKDAGYTPQAIKNFGQSINNEDSPFTKQDNAMLEHCFVANNNMVPNLVSAANYISCGTIENVYLWYSAINYLSESAFLESETGYITDVVIDEESISDLIFDSITSSRAFDLSNISDDVADFIRDLEKHSGNTELDEDDYEIFNDNFHKFVTNDDTASPVLSAIYNTSMILNDLAGYFAAHIVRTGDSLEDEGLEVIDEIRYSMTDKAVSEYLLSIENIKPISKATATYIHKYKEHNEKNIKKLISHVASEGHYFTDNLQNYYMLDHNALGHKAEYVSLGFHKNQEHPDYFINSLIQDNEAAHKLIKKLVEKCLTEDEAREALSDKT
ncbi:hypothetical protein [Vibrio barjaei]|uniref:hypothetical protein n=1 Tax=Vibrio barjaei TaxID=1676683 RepID=UPI0022839E21|nr:hypothetical protein [Vibrio barjaei]MCY9872959.1 hypothetical protein [Vibrio barjaei]